MEALKFKGSGAEYFKIWIVNILLTIVTLGLYYPWAKVRNNRYFFANSTLEGRNFEYHATGKQLFIGYLIALGLFIFYTIISSISPTGGVIVILLFFAAFPWIVWRSLSFKLRMTSFSNVRFSFDGTMGGAYFNYMLLPIACFIALYATPALIGIMLAVFGTKLAGSMMAIIGSIVAILFISLAIYLFAYMKKRNNHYKLNGYRYGQGHFKTKVEVKPFVMIILKTIGLSLLLYLAMLIVFAIIAYFTVGLEQLMSMSQSVQDPDKMQDSMNALVVLIGPVYLAIIFLSFLVLAYSYTRQRQYIFSNSVLDEKINFASTLTARKFAWVMTSNFIAIIFTLGLAVPWAKVRMARHILENTQVDTSIGFDEYLTQKQKEQSSLGEQIGDAFDVDIDIGF